MVKDLVVSIVILSLITALFVYLFREESEDRRKIMEDGRQTSAVVIKFVSSSRHGDSFKYAFYVDGLLYDGWYDADREDYSIGDTIDIIYYVEDPDINYEIKDFEKKVGRLPSN